MSSLSSSTIVEHILIIIRGSCSGKLLLLWAGVVSCCSIHLVRFWLWAGCDGDRLQENWHSELSLYSAEMA